MRKPKPPFRSGSTSGNTNTKTATIACRLIGGPFANSTVEIQYRDIRTSIWFSKNANTGVIFQSPIAGHGEEYIITEEDRTRSVYSAVLKVYHAGSAVGKETKLTDLLSLLDCTDTIRTYTITSYVDDTLSTSLRFHGWYRCPKTRFWSLQSADPNPPGVAYARDIAHLVVEQQ